MLLIAIAVFRCYSLIVSLITTLALMLSLNISAFAISTQKSSEPWNFADIIENSEIWANLSAAESIAKCDLPEATAKKLSTEKLAQFVVSYPFWVNIWSFDSVDAGISSVISNSSMCKEFFSRTDSIDALLDVYSNLDVDYRLLSSATSNDTAFIDSNFCKERFLIKFFGVNIDSLSATQRTSLISTIGNRYEMKKGICDEYNLAYSIYPDIQKTYGEVPSDLIPDNILIDVNTQSYDFSGLSVVDVLSAKAIKATAGWSATSEGSAQFVNGAYHQLGTYTKYNVTAICFKYVDGDFEPNQASQEDSVLRALYPNWNYYSIASRKYNCASYALLETTYSNQYWSHNDAAMAYVNSSYFTQVSGTSVSSGDIIIFKSGSTPVHFGIAISSGSNGSAIIKAKMGTYGVYSTSLTNMMSYYGASSYTIYR